MMEHNIYREFLCSKIHRATVTQSNRDYEGSITIDFHLMDLADIYPYQKVLVASVDSGERFETYAIAGDDLSGIIGINGAAANKIKVGEKVIIMSFEIKQGSYDRWKLGKKDFSVYPKIVFVDSNNKSIEKEK
jgi:aspartate 1-decarboxylase